VFPQLADSLFHVQAFCATQATNQIARWREGEPERSLASEAAPVHPPHHPSPPRLTDSSPQPSHQTPNNPASPPAAAHFSDSSYSSSTVASAARAPSGLLQHIPASSSAATHEGEEAASRRLFEHLDRDSNGSISVDELRQLLSELGEEWPEAQAERLMSEHCFEESITFDKFGAFQQQCLRILGQQALRQRQPGPAQPGPPACHRATFPAKLPTLRSVAPLRACAMLAEGAQRPLRAARRIGGAKSSSTSSRAQRRVVKPRREKARIRGDDLTSWVPPSVGRPVARRAGDLNRAVPGGGREDTSPASKWFAAQLGDGSKAEAEPVKVHPTFAEGQEKQLGAGVDAWPLAEPTTNAEWQRQADEDFAIDTSGPSATWSHAPTPTLLTTEMLDSIPGGLSAEGWSVADLFKVNADGGFEQKRESFKLIIDDMTSSTLLDAQGALMSPSGDVSIILPQQGPMVIGASASRGCDVVLDDERVSGRHCLFEVTTNATSCRLVVTDLMSTNGVFKNSVRIKPFASVEVKEGDEIALGARAYARFRVAFAEPDDVQVRLAPLLAELPPDLCCSFHDVTPTITCLSRLVVADEGQRIAGWYHETGSPAIDPISGPQRMARLRGHRMLKGGVGTLVCAG
jgi:pSer/pThr/pTyr-binding forkhead associated (FHA) protein